MEVVAHRLGEPGGQQGGGGDLQGAGHTVTSSLCHGFIEGRQATTPEAGRCRCRGRWPPPALAAERPRRADRGILGTVSTSQECQARGGSLAGPGQLGAGVRRGGGGVEGEAVEGAQGGGAAGVVRRTVIGDLGVGRKVWGRSGHLAGGEEWSLLTTEAKDTDFPTRCLRTPVLHLVAVRPAVLATPHLAQETHLGRKSQHGHIAHLLGIFLLQGLLAGEGGGHTAP